VIQLAQKFDADMPHAEHVAKLALTLFDGLRARHGLGDAERETLHFASLLHDVGNAIGFDGHAEHSYYVIRHGRLRGLSEDEIERIAAVARFHSKSKPRKRERAYRDLDKQERTKVRWLSALLRIAEGLDRSHYQLIRSVRVVRGQKSIGLKVTAVGDAQLEIWSARRRADVLEEVLGMPVRVSPETAGTTHESPETTREFKRAARRAALRARGITPAPVVSTMRRKTIRRPVLRAVRGGSS
jgi:exopolyphosphatase/guanosine-5'-triphosphate,3'-diphosphate pyrophosphatase